MKLFDYIKALFSDKKDWDELSSYEKKKNSFMTRRLMSIQYPTQANELNLLDIDPVSHTESWRLLASKYTKVPKFIYTKTKSIKKSDAPKLNESVVDIYIEANQISRRDFNDMLKFYPKETIDMINRLESQIKTRV